MLKIKIQILGTNPGESLHKSFEFGEILIGRLDSSQLKISLSDVSSKHAIISYKSNGELYIKDLGSSNGTFINDKKIAPDKEYLFKQEDIIIVGSAVLTFIIDQVKPAEVKQVEKKEEPSKQVPSSNNIQTLDQFEQEIAVRRLVHNKLIERFDLRRKEISSLEDTELRAKALEVVRQIVHEYRWEIPDSLDRDKLIKNVLDEALGLGPLEELLADEKCSEIMVNSYKQIYAERGGRLALSPYRFSSEQAVLSAIERIIAPIGRRIDESSPMVDARLKDGSRVNAVIRPLALAGPCITIRKFSKTPLSIDDLIKYNAVTSGMATFIKIAVEARKNVVISGGTGSGKTTLLNVISSFIPQEQRIITVEDAAELQLSQEHLVAFETRPPNLEGKGAITIRDLVRNALRMRPDRIIVGECRGAETLDMLQAMNTGHDGSMTTGHANSPTDMLRRLETMVLTAGLDLPVRAIREQISSAVNLIVQQTRFSCGTRKVTSISEITGMDYDEGTVSMQEIFVFKQDGFDEDGKIKGVHQPTGYVPKFFRAMQERGLKIDSSIFSSN